MRYVRALKRDAKTHTNDERVIALLLVCDVLEPRCKPRDGLRLKASAVLRPYVPGVGVPIVCWANAFNWREFFSDPSI